MLTDHEDQREATTGDTRRGRQQKKEKDRGGERSCCTGGVNLVELLLGDATITNARTSAHALC